MNAELLDMASKRVQDRADLVAFEPMSGGRRVSGQSFGLLGPPAGFCAPYLRGGRPWITAGFIDGTKIDGTDGPLPDLAANTPVFVVCKTAAEVLTIEGSNPGVNDIVFKSGRYSIVFARLSTVAVQQFEIVGGFHHHTRSRLLFRTGQDGSLPVYAAPHFRIDPLNLYFN